MNIQHLKFVIVVAETGSISKAAEKLYIAQPNVSRAIKELESDLGIIIFERNKKGMVPTPDGERLIEYSKRLLNQFDEMERVFKNHQKKNIFTVSVPRASYISSAFVEFSKSLSKIDSVEVFYKETNAYRVINNIINENYNLGIIRYSTTHDKYFKELLEKKEFKYELVNEFKYVLLFNRNSILNKKEQIKYTDLQNLIEIAHGDPYVPSLPIAEISKTEFNADITRRIFVFERASQFELLEKNDDVFMWVSPIPDDILQKYNLVQKECSDNTKIYKDVLIYQSSYTLSELDRNFITSVCESKRKIKANHK